jgi:hypothetical protein
LTTDRALLVERPQEPPGQELSDSSIVAPTGTASVSPESPFVNV